MAAVDHLPDGALKVMLQSAVQSVQWTYIIFWQFCPQQRVLVWGDGYYNGAIKTRKTVQSVEVSTEEAALSRSEQIRELYDSLANDDQQVPENQQMTVRRPSVALSPEDLSESEWFYLMCVSFSHAPGDGVVGKAYEIRQHVWLTGANQVDSKVFARAILAKSADIQTVICIPLLNGVVELGTTEKVEETVELIQHVKLFFMVDKDNPILPHPKSAHSTHSSNTTLFPHHISPTIKPIDDAYSMNEDIENEEEEDDDDGEEEEVEEEIGLDFVAETCQFSGFQRPNHENKKAMGEVMEANELLQLDAAEDIRFGSVNDNSSHLDSCFNLLVTSQDDSCRAESTHEWSDKALNNQSSILLQASEILAQEDTDYSTTVSRILNNQLTQRPNSNTTSLHNYLSSIQSSFDTWTPNFHPYHHLPNKTTSNSQKLLKNMLFNVPFFHSKNKSIDASDTSESFAITTHHLRKTSSHEELSVNHVLAERRRREKLNERFVILRSLVPLVTKTDKASILGDTIEYVKQLRKKIHDLEEHGRTQNELDRLKVADKRKIRVVEGGGGGTQRTVGTAVQVEVSIIESDALVEMQCKHRDGLLLDVMKKLRELGVEIITIQSCVDGGMCTAEMRAKVKVQGGGGKRISIMQVKKAINQTICL